MTLNEFRLKMTSYRLTVDNEAKLLKSPNIALEMLLTLYKKFDDTERSMADEVLCEWILSEDDSTRFDALALIDEFKIKTAVPTLHELATRLASDSTPGAPYELKKVSRIIEAVDLLGSNV